jgi:hypothetical protein
MRYTTTLFVLAVAILVTLSCSTNSGPVTADLTDTAEEMTVADFVSDGLPVDLEDDLPPDCETLCLDKQCGELGPKGTCDCGQCNDGYACREEYVCEADCETLCQDLECGLAGLDGECECGPECNEGYLCIDGFCEPDCEYFCDGRECGEASPEGECDCGICDDSNECTADSCAEDGMCQYEGLNDVACDDQNPCTVDDICETGICVTQPKDCDDQNVCTDDSCDIETGDCIHTSNTVECDDEDPCTVGDQCSEAVCAGEVVDCDCDVDEDCEPLEDDNLCNGTLHCDTSKLPHLCKVMDETVIVCPEPNPEDPDAPCQQATCEPETGECGLGSWHDGYDCEKGNLCTVDDFCQDGECQEGTEPANCSDANPCTNDVCEPDFGCGYVPNVEPCKDGNPCTLDDYCADGVCQSGPSVNCDDSNPCTTDTCVPGIGCAYEHNLVPCDDKNSCTAEDYCLAGECHPGTAVDCTDGNECTDDSCHPVEGCANTANDGSCDDGNPCTTKDKCIGGQCIGGIPFDCDDENPCSLDQCEDGGGCTHVPFAGDCDDDNPCTTGDNCALGQCLATGTDSCNDDNPCTTDSCDPDEGCLHVNNELPCNDGTVCTLNDFCKDGQCDGQTVDCDDNNTCTLDTCDPVDGCQYEAGDGQCDDDNPCTLEDHCEMGKCVADDSNTCDDKNPCTTDYCIPAQGCEHDFNTAFCSDLNACTEHDTCAQGVCLGADVDCDDGNPCTDDVCDVIEGCLHTFNVAQCNDQNTCTTDDVCLDGQCIGNGSLECDDQNPCTKDICLPEGGCDHESLTGNACSDDEPCTLNDICEDGKCIPGEEKDCNDDNPCTDESCDQDGECIYEDNVDDCDDGNICTEDDFCLDGLCQHGKSLDCGDDNSCTDDWCDPLLGCQHEDKEMICNDGNACTTGDYCSEGECLGTIEVDCNDNNPCTDDSCNEASGCVNAYNTLTCSDGNECTTGDTCLEGVCTPAGALACDDSNSCTKDWCLPEDGCGHDNIDTLCSDGDSCTTGDACVEGLCQAGEQVVCNDENPCTDDACVDGQCQYVANEVACDDSNPCTIEAQCQQGECIAIDTNECDDENMCTTDYCDPADGCHNDPNTLPCSDDNACTSGDICSDGACSGVDIDCDDGNDCTTDSCDETSGCVNDNNTLECDDNNTCTTPDICSDGACIGTGPQECDDSNPCTKDICLLEGGCDHTNIEGACDDDKSCTLGDYCADGTCQSGEQKDCDDSNPCTDDSCSADGVCQHDSNEADCSDQDECTDGDHCEDGSCVYESLTTCDDSNVCTTDSCHPATGCEWENNDNICSDSSACTLGDHCEEGACVYDSELDCDDDNICTDDSCTAAGGCLNENNSAACSDNDVCTDGDVCADGACTVGDTVDCDDGVECTLDTCHATAGCINTSFDSACNDGDSCTLDSCDEDDDCQNVNQPVDCLGSWGEFGACEADGPGSCTGTTIRTYLVSVADSCSGEPCEAEHDATDSLSCNMPADGECDDDNACTLDDTCSDDGQCLGTEATSVLIVEGGCDDGDACTTDECTKDQNGEQNCSTSDACPGLPVINEVDYDQPGADDNEFIEIYNPGQTLIDLTRYRLELVNGTNSEVYDSFNLDEDLAVSVLEAGQYLVVGKSTVLSILPDGQLGISLGSVSVQNGAPDGIRIVHITTGELIDGLHYEGTMDEVGEGANPGPDTDDQVSSLVRCPNGSDSGDNDADFTLTGTITPGATNNCDNIVPINCQVSNWGDWTECAAEAPGSCSGTRSHTRTVKQHPFNGGEACPVLEKSEACDMPENTSCDDSAVCTLNDVCDDNGGCAGTDATTIPLADGGCDDEDECTADECADDSEQVDCTHTSLAVNCAGSWGDWGDCTVDCGGGTQTKTYTVTEAAFCGGDECEADNGDTQSQECNTNACSCELGPDNPDNGEYGTCLETLHGETCPLTCNTGYYATGDAAAECDGGNWTNGETCEACESNCDGCTDASNCTDCADNYYLLDENCVADCPAEGAYYNDNDVCGTCSENCTTCTDAETCTDCDTGFFVDVQSGDWTQTGADIDGEAIMDGSGGSVSLSADGSVLAIGAQENSDNGSLSGHVRVYHLVGSTWTQMGADIDGEAAGDSSGGSVSLSSDGSILAIGARNNDGNGSAAGHVRVYQWDGLAWNLMGADIDGEAGGDLFGYSVSLSSDGSQVAIGARSNDGNGNLAGHVRVYQWDGLAWTQMGADIDGEASGDSSGHAISLSSDGSRVAIGANDNDGNGDTAGHVRVYQYSNSNWTQLGTDIDGEAVDDQSGYSVSLSSDGSRVAIGARGNEGSSYNAGHVRIYEWNGSQWTQLGTDIDGEAMDRSGYAVSLSSDGNLVAIGAPYNSNNGSQSGQVRLYEWSGSAWTQVGNGFDGEAASDYSGIAVSLSSNGNMLAIGATGNDDGQFDSGHVRVYSPEDGDATCSACEVNCDGCDDADTCTTCNNNTYLLNGSCVADCPGEGAYYNGNGVCEACETNCDACTDGDTCTDPADGYYLDGGTPTACGDNCTTCTDGTTCTDCNVGYFVETEPASWTQVGANIEGIEAQDFAGYSVSLSSDGSYLAVGAVGTDTSVVDTGQVRVYQWSGSAWDQVGAGIDGEAMDDQFGVSVSLSGAGSRVAIGAPYNDGNGGLSGHARMYEWNGSVWSQMGSDIDGESSGDKSGATVSLSSDGSVVAVSAYANSASGYITGQGHVRIYEWNGSEWALKGDEINGEASSDGSGISVSLSSNGNIVAIGAFGNDGNGNNSGHVRVYVWDGTAWIQQGADIDGEAASDYSGRSVSLSSDGSIVAIGAANNDGNGNNSGHVRVYQWDGSAWTQLGVDINGDGADDQAGYRVSLADDGTTLAMKTNSGDARVYEWNGSAWTQSGSDIGDDISSISVSGDGDLVAIGSYLANAYVGHSQVFSLQAGPATCTACEANCDECSDATTCTECAEGYTLSGGNCSL